MSSKLCIKLIIAMALVAHPTSACTVMRMELSGQLIVARNHDWGTGGGLLIVNPRGIEKTAITPVNPAKWISRYGSISFAQFGREIPFAGMNEKGLTVDLLQLGDATFPDDSNGKPSVNVVQWVQYQLDTSGTVADVLASLDEITPMPFIAKLEKVHYFVTDASGDVAVIEYLNGKPIVQHDPVTACVLANSTWDASLRASEQGHPSNSSERRFLRACSITQKKESDAPIDDAMSALNKVAQSHTQWNLVYEPERLRITFQTRLAPQRRWIDLNEMDFEIDADVVCVDVNATLSGNVRDHLHPFARQANQKIVDDAFDAIIPAGFVRSTIKEMVLNYGDSLAPALVE
ncbi:penicillin V acylase-like amidase (Ntn superfamily) [Rhodopirellula rubra]|uniref:Penicillin V acylase-like amidase (Ntn superfamily) n=1 Tax=Aporhodopirellula rubra TaxID=980271 RepID=A0A7W5E3Y1_9BACT|nr:linear amide C-N hydrolase [Aporhodopirellula rubra]MBB3209756.1 penicillin V acylase-like amidase (Ntn superfamily) [Aporhodopirellula rubra]